MECSGQVLLTGAAGFTGSYFADRLLERGGKVVGLDLFDDSCDPAVKRRHLEKALDHATFTLVRGDIRDRGVLSSLSDTVPEVRGVVQLAEGHAG